MAAARDLPSPNHRVRGRCARGFTLLEILIVLAILVVLAGLAWPAMHRQLVGAQLPESADRFRSALYLTRSAAMMEHRRFRIRFVPDEQQPYIEYEPDPIGRPGEFAVVNSHWASEPVLLEGVHVHDVIPGRPAYLTPVASVGAVEDVGVESTEDLNAGQGDVLFQVANAVTDENADERRPALVFESDGTTQWATIVITELPPGEALGDDARQYWVVLDGRTGLAKVQEGITEEQLASAEFTIDRANLLPPQTNDVKDMTLNITTPASGDTSGLGAGGLGALGLTGGAARGGDSHAMSGGGSKTSHTPDRSGKNQSTRQPRDPSQPADHSGSSATNPQSSKTGQDSTHASTMEELEQKLANTDLSEEEKDKIRQSFQQNQH